MVLLFGIASFLGAGLLFLVQPMAGKVVLPQFGGSPSVWNTSLLFFQLTLLAGYAYAHVSTRALGLRRQPLLHAVVLLAPLLAMPIAFPTEASAPQGASPALALLYVLAVTIGAPFFLLSTSSPLLQRWLAATDHHRAHDPYFLYAAGNAGSLSALLAYPFLVEPNLSIHAQTRLWSIGYAVFVIVALACVADLFRRRAPDAVTAATVRSAQTAGAGTAATVRPATSTGAATARPATSREAATVRPATGTEAATVRPATSTEAATVCPATSAGPAATVGLSQTAPPATPASAPPARPAGTGAAATMAAARPAGAGTAPPSVRPVDGPLGWRRQLNWVLLAFLPSSLMLGVTHFMSTDIAAFPLLWIVPLALYLLTFVVAFGQPHPRLALHTGRLLPAAVLAVAITMVAEVPLPPGLEIGLHLLLFTTVALGAHGRLAADRPHPARLTHFYLLVSVGGALGGLFNALLAPVVFEQVLEYPLVIVASMLVLLGGRGNRVASGSGSLPQRAFEAQAVIGVLLLLQQVVARVGSMAAVVLVGVLLGARGAVASVAGRRPLAFAIGISLVFASAVPLTSDVLHAERTFFGVARVEAEGDRHVLVHGTTIHGWQDRRPDHIALPKSYYDGSGPAGDVFEQYGHRPLADQVALVGLGTGALAAFGRSGQTFTFYEIDQAIVDIATDPQLFTYLRDSAAAIEIVLGDGRLSLRDAPADHFGIIVIDGFSSDAIPVHLVTAEAVELYRSKLRPGGVLLFHISNRHVDLEPVLGAIAARQNLSGVVGSDATDPQLGEVRWVALAEGRQSLAPLIRDPRWRPLVTEPGQGPAWTDDFSNVVQAVRWR